MKFQKKLAVTALFAALAAASVVAQAQTVRIANQGDALSMDPHSLNESLQLSVTSNVYEPLVGRNKDLSLAPALATSWKQIAPTVWRFELRKGVQFHDGTPFTADDVAFSLARAPVVPNSPSSYSQYTKMIARTEIVDPLTIRIHTKGPAPGLPHDLAQIADKYCPGASGDLLLETAKTMAAVGAPCLREAGPRIA